MSRKGYSITGTDNVRELLTDIAPKHSRNLLRATMHGVAGEIVKGARREAPKDEGTLRKAIKAKRKKSHPDKPMSDVIITHGNDVKNDAFYWRFLEYGTVKLEAQPFIAPAAEAVRANLDSIIAQQFGKKLNAALRREQKKRRRAAQ